VVRKLDKQGISAPKPYLPSKGKVTADDLKRAARSFEEAVEFCRKCSPYEWRTQYGVTSIDSIVTQMEDAIETIRDELARIERDEVQPSGADGRVLTIVR
jgi:hypothetical protein